MCFKIRSIRFFCCCDTTKNLEKSPKIQSKFAFMNSSQKFIHLSTQNLNLGLEFKTGQNHPVNRTKNNTGIASILIATNQVCDWTDGWICSLPLGKTYYICGK